MGVKSPGARSRQASAARKKGRVRLLVGTRKGAFILRSDPARREWSLAGPVFLGSEVNHLVADPRDGRTLLMGARTGHLGPTVFRSRDGGRKWQEATSPPAFPQVGEGEQGRRVERVFWITPGHPSRPGEWYAGSVPHGLFRSGDGGESWEGVAGFNENPELEAWSGPGGGATPGGPITHSVLVDPRDPEHLYLGLSVGGLFESTDGGAHWRPLNKDVAAEFLPDENAEYGHDPHCVVLHPLQPDRLYQQNHCGIYRLDRPEEGWVRIGLKLPRSVGDVGFPIAVHPRDPDTVWVFPMDGTDVWPRTCPRGKPAVYESRNAGRSWKRLDQGLPASQAWLTVFRQGFAVDTLDPVGLYFGTTGGELWASRNEGGRWRCIARHLPQILAVETLTEA